MLRGLRFSIFFATIPRTFGNYFYVGYATGWPDSFLDGFNFQILLLSGSKLTMDEQ